MPPMTVEELRAYAQAKARQATKLPVKVVVGNIPDSHIDPRTGKPDTVMRSYRRVFYPNDKNKKPHVAAHEIRINEDYFKAHASTPEGQQKLRMGACHEAAHCAETSTKPGLSGHGSKFRALARKLGADKTHQNARWDARRRPARRQTGLFGLNMPRGKSIWGI